MLTITAYDLLNIIVTGPVDVHVLRLGIIDRVKSERAANEVFLCALFDLAENGCIEWEVHEHYGTAKPLIPEAYDGELIVSFWLKIFGLEGPAEDQPNPSTILIQASDVGKQEVELDKYRIYRPLLAKMFGWD